MPTQKPCSDTNPHLWCLTCDSDVCATGLFCMHMGHIVELRAWEDEGETETEEA